MLGLSDRQGEVILNNTSPPSVNVTTWGHLIQIVISTGTRQGRV